MAALAALQSRAIITPSATSASEDADEERRRELSPSPEVDLSSPEFDDMDDDDVPMPGTPIGSFSGRHTSVLAIAAQNHRAASPPLEKDEKEFTQTADGLQKRKLSGDLLGSQTVPVVEVSIETDEHTKDDGLFGAGEHKPEPAVTTNHVPSMAFLASPAMLPTCSFNSKKEAGLDGFSKLDNYGLDWDRSPESVELDELDLVLNDFYY